jgi:arsenite methyltransferase
MASSIALRAAAPFFRQFGAPHGLLGRLAGAVMARENVGANEIVLDALELTPADRVLDVGCGPGVALGLAAPRAGFVVGADPSRVMVAQARRRLRAERAAAVVRAPAERLPFADASFTCALAVNSFHHWDSQAAGLGELRRVLEPGGRLALAVRGRKANGSPLDPHADGAGEDELARVAEQLAEAGFAEVARHDHELRRELLVVFLAR